MRIRRAKSENDFTAIKSIDAAEFVDELELDKGYWWVAVTDEGTIVAFAGLQPSQNYVKAGYLCRCVVVPQYRRRGIQQKLIRARERHARKLSWRHLVTDTAYDNYGSINALISSGYKVFEGLDWATYPSPLYWRKRL